MPMVIPMENESVDNFRKRCMSDSGMVSEFPDSEQRLAVCMAQLELKADNPDNPVIQPTEKTQIVCVFPFQNAWLEDYQSWHEFTEEEANEIIANFQDPNVIKPIIDKKHEYGESYGDILRLFIDEREIGGEEKRGLYAEIRLNPAGVELVKDRVFKGLSPSIRPYVDLQKKKYNRVLWALSLVNFQGLGTTTPELQAQIELAIKQKRQEQANMKNLALQLGLQSDSGEAQILEKVKSLQLSLEAAQAEKDEAEKKKMELQTETGKMNELITELQKQINDLLDSMKMKEEMEEEKKADEAVEMAVKQGKIQPILKDVFKKMYRQDKAGFELTIQNLTPAVSMERKSLSGGSAIELSADQIELAKKHGIDVDSQQGRMNFLEIMKKGAKK